MVGVALALGQEAGPRGGREVEELICHRTQNGEISWVCSVLHGRGQRWWQQGRTRACQLAKRHRQV